MKGGGRERGRRGWSEGGKGGREGGREGGSVVGRQRWVDGSWKGRRHRGNLLVFLVAPSVAGTLLCPCFAPKSGPEPGTFPDFVAGTLFVLSKGKQRLGTKTVP